MFAAPLLLAFAMAGAQQAPPTPERWVTDVTGQLSAPAVQALDGRLEMFEDLTGHQVLLWIGPSAGEAPESFALRAFDAWKPGRAGLDDGLVMFLFPDDRRSRIEVGYGLEGLVPDAVASRVLGEVVAPRLQADDWDGATAAGMDALLVAIDPDAAARSGARAPAPAPMAPPSIEWVVPAIVGVLFLVLLVVRPRLALSLLWAFARMSRSGGGGPRGTGGSRGGGGGGFRGGGGRSGGGGASGSW